MSNRVNVADYRALADLRYLIRTFLARGDAAAHRVGLEPQQYQLMLAVRGFSQGQEATIQALAERLALKHHSTVELVDRMEEHRYVCRRRSADDRRCVLVFLLPQGKQLLEQVARQRLTELREEGPALVNAMDVLLGRKGSPRSRRHKLRLDRDIRGTKSKREQG